MRSLYEKHWTNFQKPNLVQTRVSHSLLLSPIAAARCLQMPQSADAAYHCSLARAASHTAAATTATVCNNSTVHSRLLHAALTVHNV